LQKIKDDASLGMNILNNNGSPADIILSQNKMVLNGQDMLCDYQFKTIVKHVRAADHYDIQGLTEHIIDVFTDKKESDENLSPGTVIVEPTDNFKQNFPLIMAASTADIIKTLLQK
jgi:hypothetical protein